METPETSGILGPSALGFIQRIHGTHRYFRSQFFERMNLPRILISIILSLFLLMERFIQRIHGTHRYFRSQFFERMNLPRILISIILSLFLLMERFILRIHGTHRYFRSQFFERMNLPRILISIILSLFLLMKRRRHWSFLSWSYSRSCLKSIFFIRWSDRML